MVKIIFFVTSLVAYAIGTDYCDNEIVGCKATPHIGCPYVTDFDYSNPKCKKWSNIELAFLTEEDKDSIVHEHNLARQRAAQGEKKSGVYGARLCKMTWDDDLEDTAQQNVLKCHDDHDPCRNTPDFFTAGQNIYNSYTTNPNGVPTNQEAFTKGILKWEAEVDLISSADEYDSLDKRYTLYGHYSQLVKENACKIGCAMVRYEQDGKYKLYIVCNYSAGNLLNSPIFSRGTAASGCKKADREYPGLCSLDEEYEIPSISRSLLKSIRGGSNGGSNNGNHYGNKNHEGRFNTKASKFDHRVPSQRGHSDSFMSFFGNFGDNDDFPGQKSHHSSKTVVKDDGKGKTYTITETVYYY